MTEQDQQVAVLVVEQGIGDVSVIPLDQESLLLGKDPSSDFVVDNPYVSRQHAEIRREEDGYWIVDLGSKNATLLNGQRIEADRPYALQSGDRLLLGDFQIEFVADAS